MNIEVNFNISVTTDASNLSKIQKLVEEIRSFSVNKPTATDFVPEPPTAAFVDYIGMDILKQINIVSGATVYVLVEMCEQYLAHDYNFDGRNHMVQSICSQFRSKGYLTDRQENTLRVALSCLLNHTYESNNYYAKDTVIDNQRDYAIDDYNYGNSRPWSINE